MRFNTPPAWPAAPDGWSPQPGWTPDAQWPLPEPGWTYWLTDGGLPAPIVDFTVPAWDPRAVGAALPAPVMGAPLGNVPPTGADPADVDPAEIAAAQKKALGVFALGVLVFVIGAGSALYAAGSSGGGTIWTGGMLFGLVLFWRAWRMHRAVRSVGGRGGTIGRVAVAGGAVACLVVGVFALGAMGDDSAPSAGELTGSCWSNAADDMLDEVPCDGPHDYRVISEVSDVATCPENSPYYVELPSTFGCLVDD